MKNGAEAPVMSTKPGHLDPMDPFVEDELDAYHSPEPWRQEGRYIRDASGAIVVRGRTVADARRIAAAINATRNIPTDALEGWHVQDVSDPRTRPDLEVFIHEEPVPSRFAVRPPEAGPVRAPIDSPVPAPGPATPFDGERRNAHRRREDRRAVFTVDPETLVFDRRVMERRFADRRGQ
jgi:hypothetical protein